MNLAFDYDGQLGDSTASGQLGRLTRAHGDGWERSELFDPLGRAYYQRIALTGWRDVTREKTYRVDGSVASDTLTVADATGAVRFSSTEETELDGLGRVGALKVDGAVLYTLSYDGEGRLARADFSSGEAITFDHDPVTHTSRGYNVEAPAASGGVHWDRDTRGLVRDEVYNKDATTTQRDYGYDGRGVLTSAATATEVATYSYTASGLPDAITDLSGTRTVHHTASTLSVGDLTYTWDTAGRVVGKGEWTFQYGPNGQLTHANRPGRQVDFVYDDTDQRLLKRIDGTPVRANIAGGVLTEDHFVVLITVGGVVAGLLDNGVFTALLTDPRGTPFAGPDGTPGLASPYGVRASHLGAAEVIDYTRLGWDPDLDVVRMGVRDYDPKLSQFLTPDPLYFEDLEKCQSSSLQCSLFGYAGGNPISFVDPSGYGVIDWLVDSYKGQADEVIEMARGLVELAHHPVAGVIAVDRATKDPQALKLMVGQVLDSGTSCLDGNGSSCGHLAITVGTLLPGADALGVGKLEKLAELGKAGELAEGAKAARVGADLAEATRTGEALEGGSLTRRQAMAKAQEHAQVPRVSKGGQTIPFDELNGDSRGANAAELQRRGSTSLGRRDPRTGAEVFDHPDGHPALTGPGQPPHHSVPHVHGKNAAGDVIIIPYKVP